MNRDLVESPGPRSKSRLQRILAELRGHPLAYGVMAAFVVLGPVLAHLIFPEAPLAVAIAGGLAFGIWAALCAVPGEFI